MTVPFVTSTDPCPPALPVVAPAADTVIACEWLPDIDPAIVRVRYRVRDQVTPPRLREALIAAIVTVGNDLAGWIAAQQAAGYASLADVPAPKIDGESRLLSLYRRAVALNAKAEVVERYRDIDITGAGERKVDDLDASIGELRRDATHAVRDMLGRTRTTVELI